MTVDQTRPITLPSCMAPQGLYDSSTLTVSMIPTFFALAAESYQSALRLGLDSPVLRYKLGSAYFNRDEQPNAFNESGYNLAVLMRWRGLLLLRRPERTSLGLLLHEPPRNTR